MSRRKVKMVTVVEMKQMTAQKLIQPVAKDLEESLKKVLFERGHGSEVLDVGGASVTVPWTMGWFLSIQSSTGNLQLNI